MSRLACLSKYFWTSVPQCCGASIRIQQAIPRCGPEEINYVEARCPHPAPVATFAHLDVTQCWLVNFRVETYRAVHPFLSQPFLRWHCGPLAAFFSVQYRVAVAIASRDRALEFGLPRAHSHRQAHGCGRCRTSLIQVSKHNLAFLGFKTHNRFVLFPWWLHC